jgi:hypothetical protein
MKINKYLIIIMIIIIIINFFFVFSVYNGRIIYHSGMDSSCTQKIIRKFPFSLQASKLRPSPPVRCAKNANSICQFLMIFIRTEFLWKVYVLWTHIIITKLHLSILSIFIHFLCLLCILAFVCNRPLLLENILINELNHYYYYCYLNT